MKTQKQIDELIEQIRTAEEKESVTNEMEADVLECLNEKTKPYDKKHEVMSEEEYSRIEKPEPNTFYYTYEAEE